MNIAITFAFLATVASFSLNRLPAPTLPKSKPLEQIISQAQTVPAEFDADVLITLGGSGLLSNQRARDVEIEAFRMASGAQEGIALRRIDGSGPVASTVSAIFEKGIDAMSLKARAVDALIPLDLPTARDLFNRIDPSVRTSYSCEDQFYPTFSVYYSAMKHIANAAQDDEQRSQLFINHIATVHSVAQLSSLVSVLLSTTLSPRARELLALRLAADLDSLELDRRIFSSEALRVIDALAALASTSKGYVRDQLVQHARKWVIKNIANGVCPARSKQAISPDGSTYVIASITPWQYFNDRLAGLASKTQDQRINTSQLPNSPTGSHPHVGRHSSQWLFFYRIHSTMAQGGSAAQDSSRWQQEMDRYLDALLQWKNTQYEAAAVDAFYLEKAESLMDALDLFPPVRSTGNSSGSAAKNNLEPSRTDHILRELSDLFDGPEAVAIYQRRHCIWFVPAHAALASIWQNEVAAHFMLSQNPVLRLYSSLARVLYTSDHLYY